MRSIKCLITLIKEFTVIKGGQPGTLKSLKLAAGLLEALFGQSDSPKVR